MLPTTTYRIIHRSFAVTYSPKGFKTSAPRFELGIEDSKSSVLTDYTTHSFCFAETFIVILRTALGPRGPVEYRERESNPHCKDGNLEFSH